MMQLNCLGNRATPHILWQALCHATHMVRQLATPEWFEQLTQVLTTVWQQLAAAVRQLATLAWLVQLTQVLVIVQQLAAAGRHLAAVERLE